MFHINKFSFAYRRRVEVYPMTTCLRRNKVSSDRKAHRYLLTCVQTRKMENCSFFFFRFV